MAYTIIPEKIKSSSTFANVDAKYGPYEASGGQTALQVADAALSGGVVDLRTAGLTVGIKQSDGSINEYWYQPDGQGGLELVEKQAASGTGVEANPTGEATETLGKIKIGETIYTAPQGEQGLNGQNGADGKSAYELYEQAEIAAGRTPLSQEAWLASLKANIGAFKFVTYDSSAENAFTTGGIGTTYSSTIDGLTAGTDTTPDVILLMNNTDGTTAPTKTFMIATQETATEGVYEFVYAGDLQSAMPSNALTEDDIDATPTWDSDKVVASNGIAEKVAPTIMKEIPFDGGNYFIANDTGIRTSNAGWISTPYIPVQEGDVFYYSGSSGSVSIAVEGYLYDNGNYTPVKKLIPSTISATYNNKIIVIPAGVTHILAVDKKSGSALLKKKVQSSLSRLQDDIGVISSIESYYTDAYIKGQYVTKEGIWNTGSSSSYLMVDVEIGDVVELYNATLSSNQDKAALIAKKLTETTFEPLLIVTDVGTFDKTYTCGENMTICISLVSSSKVMLTLIKHNKFSLYDYTNVLLNSTRSEIAARNALTDIYDMQLGHMFENIACIGDSMSRGTLSDANDPNVGNDGTGTSSFGASWLSFLAKRWDCKSKFHYANSGTSTYTWLNNNYTGTGSYGLGRFLKDVADGKIYNAYFIAYGHNDSMTVGTASDTAATVTVTQDGDNINVSCPSGSSFCAYYKAIIDKIRANAPHAMIFCLSEYDGVMVSSGKAAYRQAIIDVAESYYNGGDKLVYHLETGGVPVSDMNLGTHYSTVGYAYIAKMVDIKAGQAVYEHRADSEIKYFGSYNTDHNADSPWENS